MIDCTSLVFFAHFVVNFVPVVAPTYCFQNDGDTTLKA